MGKTTEKPKRKYKNGEYRLTPIGYVVVTVISSLSLNLAIIVGHMWNPIGVVGDILFLQAILSMGVTCVFIPLAWQPGEQDLITGEVLWFAIAALVFSFPATVLACIVALSLVISELFKVSVEKVGNHNENVLPSQHKIEEK